MDSPGIYALGNPGDISITTAGTYVTDWLTGLDGLTAATIQLRLAYGTGGTTIDAYVQTSLDQGTTAVDIWHKQFTTASAVAAVNLSGLTAVTSPVTPSDGTLSGVQDGILGDRLRLKYVVVGIYANTILSPRVSAR